MRNKITQFWLVESSTINPKLYSEELPIILETKHTRNHKQQISISMFWSIDTCHNKVSADRYHVTISRAQVYSSSRSSVFLSWPLTKCWFSIGSRAHVGLTRWKPGSWHWLWLFNHAWWKGKEDRWNYFQCYTNPNLRVAAILAWFWWLCM